MMKYIYVILILFIVGSSAFSQELYRIRVENSQNGLVQVSLDEGKNYSCIGRVKHIANRCSEGFMASGYLEGSTVCAVASHGVRFKVSPASKYNLNNRACRIFSLVPKEFWTSPKGFGGYSAPNSGIFTDISVATGIFLNFAPFPGSVIYEEIKGNLYPLAEDFFPKQGDVFVIIANKPNFDLDHIDFENKVGGNVIINDTDVLTKVSRTVMGVGRFDATTYNRPGQLNTCHGGVITIATSKLFPVTQKEGDKPETRGGFMIQPFYHAKRGNEFWPQVMCVGKNDTEFEQEGNEPLYAKNISLWYYPDDLESSYYASLQVDGEKYINVPEITGNLPKSLTKEYLNKYYGLNLKVGVTGIRIHVPVFNREKAQNYLNGLTQAYTKKTEKEFASDSEYFVPSIYIPYNYNNIIYYVDGIMKGITGEPNKISILKSQYSPGLHHVQILAEKNGNYITFSDYFSVKR